MHSLIECILKKKQLYNPAGYVTVMQEETTVKPSWLCYRRARRNNCTTQLVMLPSCKKKQLYNPAGYVTVMQEETTVQPSWLCYRRARSKTK